MTPPGDFCLENSISRYKAPLQRSWQAVGLTEESHCQSCNTLPCRTRVGEKLFFFCFFFSVKKKRRITLGRTYWQDNSSTLSGISSRRGDLLRGKRRNNNINHLHKKYLESQHYKYRKRQTKAFASLRRTARHERIPPNGFWELSLGQCFQKLRGDASIAPYISHVSIPAQGTP